MEKHYTVQGNVVRVNFQAQEPVTTPSVQLQEVDGSLLQSLYGAVEAALMNKGQAKQRIHHEYGKTGFVTVFQFCKKALKQADACEDYAAKLDILRTALACDFYFGVASSFRTDEQGRGMQAIDQLSPALIDYAVDIELAVYRGRA
jgi:hypothetical protein